MKKITITITVNWQRAAIAALFGLTVVSALAYIGASKRAGRMERKAALYARMYNAANAQLEERTEGTCSVLNGNTAVYKSHYN